MPHPVSAAGIILRALILEKAATPQGYGACDSHHLPNHDKGARLCIQMVRKGRLHKAKVPTHFPRYFTTAAAVAHFIATTPPKSHEDNLAIYRARYAAKAKRVVKNPKADKPKPVKSLPEIKVLRPDYAKPAAIQRPKVTAVIVWPERMPACRLMPPPRNQVVVHSFIHNGMGAMR